MRTIALAVAPGVHFIGVRTGAFVTDATAAFQRAAGDNPDVISVSWGTYQDVPELRIAVAQAVLNGIVVCAACGNGGTLVFASSDPEVISVGGTYADELDHTQASSYASSGLLSAVDAGRQMPDLTGYVGQAPNGVYITVACQPDSKEDQEFAPYDGTTKSDGWMVASGTSSATPQVAAVACLLIQKDPAKFKHNPAAVKQALEEMNRPVFPGDSVGWILRPPIGRPGLPRRRRAVPRTPRAEDSRGGRAGARC